MAIELKFHKSDNTPWGFRLIGGSDFDIPLTTIKVTAGSIAEDAGMKIGDLVVRVNETPTAGLTHIQAHDVIKEAGNDFIVAVIRGELPEYYSEQSSESQVTEMESAQTGLTQSLEFEMKTIVEDSTEIIVESGEIYGENIKISGEITTDQQEGSRLTANPNPQMENENGEVIVSGEAEGLSGNEVLSVDFQKTTSPAQFIRHSEVFKALSQEEIAKENKLKEEKRWTTFLQKPKRPKPKTKKEIQEGPKVPGYRVVIKKQKRKTEAEKIAEQTSSHGSTPNPEEIPMTPEPSLTSEQEENREEEEEEQQEIEQHEENEQVENEDKGEPVISEVEMSLEDQLCAIQRQLLALSQLPAAIQQTLDVVTQQLTKIVGPNNYPNKEVELEETEYNAIEERELEQVELETLEEVSEEEGFERDSQQDQEEQEERRDMEEAEEEQEEEPAPEPEPEPEEDLTPEELEARRIEQEKLDKKKKELEIMEDLKQRRLKQRPVLPLTPLERPIFLPGGRKWRIPDDANPEITRSNMSDELIAETISSQSEIITGTTLGDCNCQLVPSKVCETKKINFLKFEPPPKTLEHLKHSEVYKLVHDLEPPLRGIGTRQAKAMAEEDYYTQIRKESTQELSVSQQMER